VDLINRRHSDQPQPLTITDLSSAPRRSRRVVGFCSGIALAKRFRWHTNV
jgi:hypothetical protein